MEISTNRITKPALPSFCEHAFGFTAGLSRKQVRSAHFSMYKRKIITRGQRYKEPNYYRGYPGYEQNKLFMALK